MSKNVNLLGKRVLLTGGSSGIGLVSAERLSAAGARLALLARGQEGLERAAAELAARPLLLAADVSRPPSLGPAVAHAVAELGGLDIVVHCAGVATFGPFTEMAPEDYEQTIATTLLGALNVAHATLAELERSGGVLVIVGSISGRIPTPWLSAYAAAKHGVRGFVRSLDCELRARGSRASVVLIAPGPVDTPIWRRSRATDRRQPPSVPGAYRPEAVSDEILRAIAHPGRVERTVGGLMAVAAIADSLAPNVSVRALGTVAGLGWRRREGQPPATADTLAQPVSEPRRGGDLHGRPSLLAALRRLRP